MTTAEQRHTALRLIFAFFLGLMVTSFIGLGVYTFYPPRFDAFDEANRTLREEKQLILDGRGVGGLTAEQRDQVRALNARLHEADQQLRQRRERWTRTSSIILIIMATLVMAVPLARADHAAGVPSNDRALEARVESLERKIKAAAQLMTSTG